MKKFKIYRKCPALNSKSTISPTSPFLNIPASAFWQTSEMSKIAFPMNIFLYDKKRDVFRKNCLSLLSTNPTRISKFPEWSPLSSFSLSLSLSAWGEGWL